MKQRRACLYQAILSTFIAAFCGTSSEAAANLTLVEKGKSAYQIVVPSNAIPSERYAAEELQRYLETIGGVQLLIVTDEAKSSAHEILLGDNVHFRKLGLKTDPTKLGTDGFLLGNEGQRLIIFGGKPCGTLYGVYTLLEALCLGLHPELRPLPATVSELQGATAECPILRTAQRQRPV